MHVRSARFAQLAVVVGAASLAACTSEVTAPRTPAAAKPSLDVASTNPAPYLTVGYIVQNDDQGSCNQGCEGWISNGTGNNGLPGQNGNARSYWIVGTDSSGPILNPQYLINGNYFNHYDVPLHVQLQPGHNDFTVLFSTGYPLGPGPWIPIMVQVLLVPPGSTTPVGFTVGQENTGPWGAPLTDTHIVGGTSVTLTFNSWEFPPLSQGGVDRVSQCCSIPDGYQDAIAHVSFDVTVLGNTNTGSNVSVNPTDSTGAATPVNLSFSNVTGTGSTTVTSIAQGPPPPDGFKLSGAQHTIFDISTTATFTGPVQVCINYTGGGQPHLMHYVNGGWVDITTGYPSPGVVCGTTTSFSPFALFDVLPPTITPAVSGTLGANGWYTSNVSVSWTVTPSFAVPTGCGPVSVTSNTSGQTITCSATTQGGSAQQSVTIMRDASPPTIAFTGATTYTVDQTVAIVCAVTPGLSGVSSQTCPGASDAAYTFALGSTTLTASATSGAGLTATSSTTFTVSVDVPSLSALVQRFTDNGGVANSLIAKLQHGSIADFDDEVNAQSGKHIPSSANAALLIRLAAAI